MLSHTMRLFRKAGGNNATKGKKNSKQEQSNEYEYVRKEYGFDYVPPSQYVPSRSMSEDEDDEDNADEETIEMQYQGAAPVKIIQPRSEISGSIVEEDEDDFSPPKPPKHYRKSRNVPKQPEYRKEKKAYRTRKTPSPVPIIPEELEDPLPVYDDDERYHGRRYSPREPEPRRHRPQKYRSEDVEARRPSRQIERGAREVVEEDHYPMGRRDRRRSEPRPARKVYRDAVEEDPVVPRRRSFHHQDSRDNLDDLDIGRVHTAYSYNSDDSAESFIEEQSRGSRYAAKERKKARRRADKKKASNKERFMENDLMDRVVVRTGTWRKTDQGWEVEGERNEPTRRRIEEYEKPRYDRKKLAARGETREEIVDDYRRSSYEREDRRKSHSGQRKPRHYRQPVIVEETRDVPDEIREEELRFDRDWEAKDVSSRRRNHAHGEASYYATPSGKVASDYEPSEPLVDRPRHSRKKSTRGFLGRIRESVRGSGRKESRQVPIEREIRVTDQLRESYRREPGPIFERPPPSMHSDVSYENRRSRDFPHKEPDVPSTLPRRNVASFPSPRETYDYEPRRQPRYEGYDEAEYPIQRRPSYRAERQAPPKPSRRVEEPEYWEVPGVQERSPSPAMLFESTRNTTSVPALRANPDHRKSTSRHHSKGVYDHYQHHPTSPMADDRGRHSNLPEHSRYAPLTSPKLIHQHPHMHESVPRKSGKGLRLGCY